MGAMKLIRKSIEIQGSADAVFEVISDLAAWPHHLPHYRWIRVKENHPDHLVARMACYRGWLPIDWLVRFEVDLAKRELRFIHLHGLTRGLVEMWQVEPVENGSRSRVTVAHDLETVSRRWGGLAVRWGIQCLYIEREVPRALAGFARHFARLSPPRESAKNGGGG